MPNCAVTSYEFDPRRRPPRQAGAGARNFVAPLQEAGAPVTAEPDAPAAPKAVMRTADDRSTSTTRCFARWPLPQPDAQRRQGGARRRPGRSRGSSETPGAVLLAATAALRAGAGKLCVATAAAVRGRARARASGGARHRLAGNEGRRAASPAARRALEARLATIRRGAPRSRAAWTRRRPRACARHVLEALPSTTPAGARRDGDAAGDRARRRRSTVARHAARRRDGAALRPGESRRAIAGDRSSRVDAAKRWNARGRAEGRDDLHRDARRRAAGDTRAAMPAWPPPARATCSPA